MPQVKKVDWHGVVHSIESGIDTFQYQMTVWPRRYFWRFVEYRVSCPLCEWTRPIVGRNEHTTYIAACAAIQHHQREQHAIRAPIAPPIDPSFS